jgi:DNA adenine methylase
MNAFNPMSRNRVRRGMNEQCSSWWTVVEGLPAVHERLRRVVILNQLALEVIRSQDGSKTLFYCDPSYPSQTRTAPRVYTHEMSDDDHWQLLDTIKQIKGKAMLSGYPSEMYDKVLADWNRHTMEVANHAAGGKTKRTMMECVWCNF